MSSKIDLLMKKLADAKEELEKARQKMSDEYDANDAAYDDQDHDLDEGYRELDPDNEDASGEEWLKENDPKNKGEDYDEYSDGEDEDAHRAGIDEDFGDVESADSRSNAVPSEASEAKPQAQASEESSPQEEVSKKPSRFNQPSKEDLMSMRAYTRPWEQRARETTRLQADPSKNPVLAHQGNIIEARNLSHGDRKAAYQQFTNSDDYKNADPVSQMEMDDNFEKDWKTKNPEHLKGAMTAHHEAHEKGKGGKDIHAAAKDAQIRNILSGGASSGEDTFSTEEGLQHAGGAKGEEGTVGSIKQDPAASFAMGNQDFIKQYAKDYNEKGKKPGNIDEMMNYNEGSKKDINRILGPGQSKDPKFEKFFSHYYPLIGMSASKTLNRLGLDPKKNPDIDMSMLHEAGMHGLIQAMNDYDHENPSKASFSTHAGNKIRGLQMTAMRNIDHVPTEVRQAQKKFSSQSQTPAPPQAQSTAQPAAPKVDLHSMIGDTKHPSSPDMQDRLKRIGSQRAVQTVKIKKPSTSGPSDVGGES